MNSTIAKLTLSTMLRKWRGIMLASLPIGYIGLVQLISITTEHTNANVQTGLLQDLGLATIVPLIALIVSTGSISTEIEEGSVIYLLTKPISRHRIIAIKYLVSVLVTLTLAALPMLIAAIALHQSTAEALAYTVAAAVSGAIYCAVLLLIGAWTKSAIVIGLIYVLIWEGLVAGFVEGAQALSIQSWSLSIASEVTSGLFTAQMVPVTATIVAVTVSVLSIWLAGRKLQSLSVA